jgi:putative hydrolase of the HAD superfamily
MKYRAVIFDLFGTLVDELDSKLPPMRGAMADALGVTHKDFDRVWSATSIARGVGGFSTLEENFVEIGHMLGVKFTSQQVKKAVNIRLKGMEHALTPRPDAISTLRRLRSLGYKIGLISNITPEVPRLWAKTAFKPLIEAPIFSPLVGLMKPDHRIFQVACKSLDTLPQHCLYIGDGDSNELESAKATGMEAILIPLRYGSPPTFRLDNKAWAGKRINTIPEVTKHVLLHSRH